MACRISLSARFWSKVQVGQPDECWPWKAAKGAGYGRVFVGLTLGGPVVWNAHRVAWVLTNGPVPEGTELDHVCHTRDTSCVQGPECPHRACANPSHLEPVTHQENAARRSVRLIKFKCGHPFSERVQNGAGGRCGACARKKESDRYYRNRPATVRSRS